MYRAYGARERASRPTKKKKTGMEDGWQDGPASGWARDVADLDHGTCLELEEVFAVDGGGSEGAGW